PRPERRPALKSVPPAPRAQQGLLNHVLRVVEGPEHPVAVQLKLRPVLRRQPAERVLVPAERRLDQCALLGHRSPLPVRDLMSTCMTPRCPDPHRGGRQAPARRRPRPMNPDRPVSLIAVTVNSDHERCTVRKLIVCNIISLDGYVDGPGGDVMAMPMDGLFDEHNLERLRAADTLLLGRTTYLGLKGFWPAVAENPECSPAVAADPA